MVSALSQKSRVKFQIEDLIRLTRALFSEKRKDEWVRLLTERVENLQETEKEIRAEASSLKGRKAPDNDESAEVVSLSASTFSMKVAGIIERVLKQDGFSVIWKRALLVLISKPNRGDLKA